MTTKKIVKKAKVIVMNEGTTNAQIRLNRVIMREIKQGLQHSGLSISGYIRQLILKDLEGKGKVFDAYSWRDNK